MTQLLTYNLNGIRSAIDKGWAEWVLAHQFDIICVQETKAQPEQVDLSLLTAAGYHAYWHSAQKKGYSGVLTLSKQAPDFVAYGMGVGMDKYDAEGRVLRCDFGSVTVLNCYFPSGTTGDVRQEFKMDFLADFKKYVADLQQTRDRIIVVGDYNIAHQEIDLHDPKSNKNTSGFLPEERSWFTNWLENGFVDAFRHLKPEEKAAYSWWSFRSGARKTNKGWRIDYQTVSANLTSSIVAATHLSEAVHSDHCGVCVTYNFL